MIPKELIEKFQKIVKDEYDRDITLEEATIILTDITVYFTTLERIYRRMQSGSKRV